MNEVMERSLDLGLDLLMIGILAVILPLVDPFLGILNILTPFIVAFLILSEVQQMVDARARQLAREMRE